MVKTMAKTTETSSIKFAKLSGKAESIKQLVKHGVKVLARPFKKLKTSIATTMSSSLTHSRSTASKELGMLYHQFSFILTLIRFIRNTQGTLAIANLHIL